MPDIDDRQKIAIAAPGTPGDFRRSRRSAYKIAKCVAGFSFSLKLALSLLLLFYLLGGVRSSE